MENEIRVFFIETQYILVLKKLSSDQKMAKTRYIIGLPAISLEHNIKSFL